LNTPADLVATHSTVQVRVKPGSCQSGGLRQNGNISLDVPERSITYQRTGLDSMTCYPRYSVWNEDISTWQNETYVASSTRKVMDRLTTANPYRNGGFIKRIPTHDIDLFLEAIGKLENSSWTDLGTRALFFEGVTYIPAVDQFLVLSILFNYGTHGTVIPQLFVTPFRNQLKKASGSDGSSNGPELLLYFIAFCNLLREFGKMKAFGTQYFKILWNVVTIVSICFVFVSVYYRYLINRQWVEIEALDTQPWRLNSEIQQWDLDWDWAVRNIPFLSILPHSLTHSLTLTVSTSLSFSLSLYPCLSSFLFLASSLPPSLPPSLLSSFPQILPLS
jgi:hypothetical protein